MFIKNFDQVFLGGEGNFTKILGGDNKLSKKGLKWGGGTWLEPKKICALHAQTLLFYHFFLQNT